MAWSTRHPPSTGSTTLFYAQYYPASRSLSYVNAGHNPPLVLRICAGDYHVFRLETGGPVVGLLPHRYQRGVFPLEAADLVVLFTDGVSESMNAVTKSGAKKD